MQPPATGAVHHDDKPGMPWRVLAPLIVSAFAMGAVLGGAEVATVAVRTSNASRFRWGRLALAPRAVALLATPRGSGQLSTGSPSAEPDHANHSPA